jgi:antitoxin Phd
MSRVWQLEEAQQNFGVLVEGALREGPQLIQPSDEEAVVVLSYAAYHDLTASRKLSDFFRESPLAGEELDLSRNADGLRKSLN